MYFYFLQCNLKHYKLFFATFFLCIFHRVSPNVMHKLEREVQNILRSQNFMEMHERKSNPNEIKRRKGSKAMNKI